MTALRGLSQCVPFSCGTAFRQRVNQLHASILNNLQKMKIQGPISGALAFLLSPFLLRYFLAGFISTVVYVVFYFLFAHFGLSNVLSSFISYAFSIVAHYMGLAYYAFRVDIANSFQFARFVVTVGFGLAVAGLVMEQTQGTPELIQFAALMLVTAIVAIFNFFMFFLWVFARRADA